jgi:lipopolysaccharide/colanic/teichoic acid biosynthesis glycosyltransferase
LIAPLPSSRVSIRIRLSPVDVTLAATSPFAALYLRDVDLVSAGGMFVADSFALISLTASLIAFRIFRVSSVIPRYFSVGDLLNLAKAVVAGELMTTIALFTLMRLDGVPRSVPAIHALILGAGLLAARGLASLAERNRRRVGRPRSAVVANIILIGLNDWSALLIKFLQARSPQHWRVMGLLDEDPKWFGRSLNGVQVFGPPTQLEAVIEEFATHGVRTDRVLAVVETSVLSEQALEEVKAVCARRNLNLVFMPDLFGAGFAECAGHFEHTDTGCPPRSRLVPNFPPTPYLRFKRLIDAIAAAVLILWLLPLLVIAAIAVFLDMGPPVLFWQQRLGRGGRELQIYKLRTLRLPFDRKGRPIPEEQRISRIGRVLRMIRLDELPQLLNVLVGDMSLIGPRPLLAQDQPPNSAIRLAVRPGITGWAQVNGGAKLSATEKAALDAWYIRNASPLLDLRIIGMTVLSLIRGDRRPEKALAQAQSLLELECDDRERALEQASGLVAGVVGPFRVDDREPAFTQPR